MHRVHIVFLVNPVALDLAVQVPDIQEAVGKLWAIIFGIQARCAFVLILLIDAEHLLRETVLEEIVLPELLHLFFERVYLEP